MIRITRWSPDTCNCKIDFSWDDAVPAEDRVHTVSRILNKCPAHQIGDMYNHYNIVVDENRRKNITFGEIKTALAVSSILFEYENFKWSYDNNRVLRVTLVGLTGVSLDDKTRAQNALDIKFGSGKVIID
jgi:hypothetical protein